ncbi:MAG: sensor histidine kinase, partial [Proteobacteria bacterium]|nr:sensor histidine kinase [Pseudomonadota bacterium]
SSQRIIIEMPDEILLANVDKQKIHQALLNVLGNALKFSAPDQPVTISMRLKADSIPPAIGILIRDHGIGMTAAHLARMGERFFRADASGNVPGTGLGISLTKEIAALHGGELEASSELGKGSSFIFWLPMAAPIPAAAAAWAHLFNQLLEVKAPAVE